MITYQIKFSGKTIWKISNSDISLIKLQQWFFPSPLCITGVRIPPPWTSGGGHPFPWYLIFVFSRRKVLQEAVLILNHNTLPSKLINIFLV